MATGAASNTAITEPVAAPEADVRAEPRRFIRAVLGWYRRRGRRGGVPDGQSGTVTVVQRFGSGLELNVHFHALSLDGVFAPERTGRSASTACRRPARPTSPGSWRQSRAGSSGCSCAADSPTTPTP